MVPSFTFDLSCPGWHRTTPPVTILQFTLQAQIINHWKAWHMKAVRQWQWGIRVECGYVGHWARDNENCASAPAVTRTSCASNWFRGRWRGNVKFYYLTHLSWFMIVTARGEGPLSTYWWAVLVFTVSQSIRSGRWEWIRAQNAWQGWYLLGTY